jgi:hypothetical protein
LEEDTEVRRRCRWGSQRLECWQRARYWGAARAQVHAHASFDRMLVAEPEPESDPQFVLTRQASANICAMMHAPGRCDDAQALSTCREETAQQPPLAQLFDSRPPALGIASGPLEDSG